MSVKLIITGVNAAKRYLIKKEKGVEVKEKIGLTKAAIFMQGEVKQSIAGHRAEKNSVDTGRFLNSVDINVGKTDAVIFSDLEYSKFLEYGTSKFNGRHHFRNTKNRNKSKAIEIVNNEIKKI